MKKLRQREIKDYVKELDGETNCDQEVSSEVSGKRNGD